MIILGIILSIIPLAVLGVFLYIAWMIIKPILKFAAIGFVFVLFIFLIIFG